MATATSKESFFWPPIVDKRTCEWCSSPVWIKDQFPSLTTSPWQQWPVDLLLDLQYCLDCVGEYHQIQEDFVAENPDKRKELCYGDVERLSLWITVALESTQETCSTLKVLNNLESTVCGNSSFKSASKEDPGHRLHVTVQELLQFPLLLFDTVLAELFEKAMVYLIDHGSPPVPTQRLSGLYVLLVNPSQKLRRWAEKTIKSLSKLTKEHYDDVQKEVQWIVEVATANMFEYGALLQAPSNIFSASCLPCHLFELPLNYWRGFLRLLLSMSEDAIRHRLLGVSGHRDLPDTIINVMENSYGKDKVIFWPAFNCFVIILESCGSHLWPLLSRGPVEVLNTITNHPVYSKALLQYMIHREDTAKPSSSADIANSQEFGSQGVANGALPKTALTWLQTFVLSVLDFDEVACTCVSEVIQYLHKYSAHVDVKKKIVAIVSTVMRSNQLKMILSLTNLWVPHVVELASLPEANSETYLSMVGPARELIVSLMIKTENSTACKSQIRSVKFNELTSPSKRQNLVKTIVSIFEESKDRKPHEVRPVVKRGCARKSMRRPSSKISKEMQINTLSTIQATEKLEPTVKLKSDDAPEIKDEKPERYESQREQHSNGSATIKCEMLTEEKKYRALNSSNRSFLYPKVELVDCLNIHPPTIIKPGRSSLSSPEIHQHAGSSKDKPILLDSEDEQEDLRQTTSIQSSPVQDFSTFSKRSAEMSRNRLGSILSPKKSSKMSPSNITPSLSTCIIDDDTSSLESNDEDLVFCRKRPRKRLPIVDDSSDETESIEEADTPSSTSHSTATKISRNHKNSSRHGKKSRMSTTTERHTVSSNSDLLEPTNSSSATPLAISHYKALTVLNRKVKSNHSLDSRGEIITTASTEGQRHDTDEFLLNPNIEISKPSMESTFPNTLPSTSSNDVKTQDEDMASANVKQETYSALLSDSNAPSKNVSTKGDITSQEMSEISEAFSRDREFDAHWVLEDSDFEIENTSGKREISPEKTEPEIKQEERMEQEDDNSNQEHYLSLEEIGKDYFADAEDGDDENGWDAFAVDKTTIDYNMSKLFDEVGRKYADLSDSDDETNVNLENKDLEMDKKELQVEDDEFQVNDHEFQVDDHEFQVDDHEFQVDDHEFQVDDHEFQVDDHEFTEGDHQFQKGDHVFQGDHEVQIDNHEFQIDDDVFQEEGSEFPVDGYEVQMEDVPASSGRLVDSIQQLNAGDSYRALLDDDTSGESIDLKALETKTRNDSFLSPQSNSRSFNDSQESARDCIEEDIKSDSDSECDDDIVFLFSQRSTPVSSFVPIKIKVEKSDDIPDVPSENVPSNQGQTDKDQAEKPVTEMSASEASLQTLTLPSAIPVAVTTTHSSESKSKPPFDLKPAEIVPTVTFNADRLIAWILHWNCDWLDAQDQAQVPIYNVLRDVEKLPMTFESIDIYYKSFTKLLYVETWEQSLRDWKNSRRYKKQTRTTIHSVSNNHQFTFIETSTRNVIQEIVTNRLFPEESELVLVEFDGYRYFGIIETVDQEVVYLQRSSSSDAEEPARFFNLTFTIRMRPPIKLSAEACVRLTVVTSLSTTLRQWSGLVSFQRSLLVKDILRPRGLTYFCADEKPSQVEANERYNKSQVRVIETATRAVHKAYTLPRISLVQGPPGTGKSHTIVGMVDRILNDAEGITSCQPQFSSQLLPEKPRILICCPSNEGVDVLVRKLLHAAIKKTNPANANSDKRNNRGGGRYKNCGDFSLVRVGRKSRIHESVKRVTLENLTREALTDFGHGSGKEDMTAIKNKIQQIEKQIDALEKENFMLKKGETEREKENRKAKNLKVKSSLISQKQTLDRQYRQQRDQTKQRKRMESRVRKEILNNADIVCSTLSGSGSSMVLNQLRGSDGKKIPFSCIIVDEACQCCELDILIPLQYMSSKLILVGDPEQLPATVFSKDARQLLYDRSMFSRLYKFFRVLPRNERPVHLLNVQYRMHPEIAHFPAKHVYNGSIHTDSSLLRRPFPIQTPYAVFNVRGARETNDGRGAISNRREVDLVTLLCSYLVPSQVQANDIGIITPYRAQLMEIQTALRHRGEFLKDIEVKTVDEFQGREKNIIIMSCVRSASNIGFLQHLNRLNVAITRARHSLFIFGNMDSLTKAGPVWEKLINNALHRKLVHDVNRIDDIKKAISMTTSSNRSHCAKPDHLVQAGRLTSTRVTHKETMTHKENTPPANNASMKDRKVGPSVHGPVPQANPKPSLSKDNGPSEKIPPTDIRASTMQVTIEDGTFKIFNKADGSSNKEGVTGPKETPTDNLFERLQHGFTSEVVLPQKRKFSSSEPGSPSSPKRVRFGNVTVVEFDKSSERRRYSYDIHDKDSSRITCGTATNNECPSKVSSTSIESGTKDTITSTRPMTTNLTTAPPRTAISRERFAMTSTTTTSTPLDSRTTSTTCMFSRPSSTAPTVHPSIDTSYKHSNSTVNSTPTTTSSRSTTGENIENIDISKQQVMQRHSTSQRPGAQQSSTVASKLDEVATRVRERTRRQRGPVEITPENYREGRAGRLRLVSDDQNASLDAGKATVQPPVELRDWHPHGGPRRRTANTTSSEQDLRSRAANSSYTSEILRPPKKRPSLRKRVDQLNKKSKK